MNCVDHEESIFELKEKIKELSRGERHENDRYLASEKDKQSLNIKIRELEASLNTMGLVLDKVLDRSLYR